MSGPFCTARGRDFENACRFTGLTEIKPDEVVARRQVLALHDLPGRGPADLPRHGSKAQHAGPCGRGVTLGGVRLLSAVSWSTHVPAPPPDADPRVWLSIRGITAVPAG